MPKLPEPWTDEEIALVEQWFGEGISDKKMVRKFKAYGYTRTFDGIRNLREKMGWENRENPAVEYARLVKQNDAFVAAMMAAPECPRSL